MSDPLGRPPALPTWGLFALLAVGYVAASAYLNRIVLDDRVLEAMARAAGSPADDEGAGASARGWALVGYAAAPALLFLRVGAASLLIQLALLPFLRNPPLGRIFRATLLGSAVLLLGNLFQTAWLSSLPLPDLLSGRNDSLPGSLAALAPSSLSLSPALSVLAGQLTVFDVAWPVVVALALDLRPRLDPMRTLVAVGGVWGTLVLGRWILFLYLLRLA